MKFKHLLYLLMSPFLMGLSIDGPIVQEINISSPRYGPYEIYQDDVQTDFSVKSTYIKGVNVYERVIFEDIDTNQSRTITFPTHLITYLKTTKIPITIPTSGFFGKEGMRITITVFKAADNFQYKTAALIIYPSSYQRINPLDYLTNDYETNTTAISFPDTEYKEQYKFHNFTDYFLTDIYYRIPLEQFAVEAVESYEDITTCKGMMTIEHGKDLFPNIKSIGKFSVISIELRKSGDFYKIFLANSIYVNPNTLHVSDTPIAGYVATNNFYLPINGMEDYQEIKIGFNITGLGYSKINLAWNTTCYYSSSFIGSCSNSEYCVVGEVKK